MLTKETLSAYLNAKCNRSIHLIITNNRTSMVSFKSRNGLLICRANKMFLEASEEVLNALAEYIMGKKESDKIIHTFIHNNINDLKKENVVLNPQGDVYNLQDIFNELNAKYFNNECKSGITWDSHKSGTKSMLLGQYIRLENFIKINTVLDDNWIPRWYVAFTVYHEMLHEKLGITVVNGRRRIHTPLFRSLEKQYAEYDRVIQWEKANIKKLIIFGNSGVC